MVGNPQMEDIQKLTADNFTKQTGIKVKFTILPENELRDKVDGRILELSLNRVNATWLLPQLLWLARHFA